MTHEQKRAEIQEMLRALAAPPTKVYTGQLPLFPIIFRLEVGFDDELQGGFDRRLSFKPIVWDADMPRRAAQFRRLQSYDLVGEPGVYVRADYHLHAFMAKQFKEREEASRRILLNGVGLFLAFVAIGWGYFNHLRERQRQQQHLLADQKVHQAETKQLQEELRRQEAERRHQEVERQNLELKSQMLANISITAGSYAHNIKNLLVRPNDLLRRCLEESPGVEEQARMLGEVKQTLGTVTERLQQILQTVRRDPSKSERVRIDLNALVREIHRTWADMARDKWKLLLETDLGEAGKPIWIDGDLSHLEQVLENLLFNARDATFEMRNSLREQARRDAGAGPLDASQRQALITAAGWQGRVVLRTRAARRPADARSRGQRRRHERRCPSPLHGDILLDQAQQRAVCRHERRHGGRVIVCDSDPGAPPGPARDRIGAAAWLALRRDVSGGQWLVPSIHPTETYTT